MIGNTLNGGTFRGDARGFQLDTLIKVSCTSQLCKVLTDSCEILGPERELHVQHYCITWQRSYYALIRDWCSSTKIYPLWKLSLDVSDCFRFRAMLMYS